MNKPLENKHPLIQLIALLGIGLISLIAIMLLGIVLGSVIWGSAFSQSLLAEQGSEAPVLYMKYLQLLSHLGMFIVPALIFGRLAGGSGPAYFGLHKSVPFSLMMLSVLVLLASMPLINLLTEWNESMSLPERWQHIETWMKVSEDEAARMTLLFLEGSSGGDLLFNLLIMALIPAIGEEFIFRGILQKALTRWFRNAWLALLLASVIFSAIHLQFYGFLPRLVLGLLLGYVFMVSGRLWLSILIHFVNNGTMVVAYWLFNNEYISAEPESIGNYNDNWVVVLFSTFVFFILLMAIARFSGRKTANITKHPTANE